MAIGDDNPLDSDDAYAGKAALPPLVCKANQYPGLPRDVESYAFDAGQFDISHSGQARGGASYTFHRRLPPDDVATSTWEITDVTEQTTRSGSSILVVTSPATYTDQHGGPLADNDETIIFVAPQASS